MKSIKQLLELGDKRTQGEWHRDVSKAIFSTHKGIRQKVIGQTWYKEKEKYGDFFSPEDLEYVINTPAMEAKLREMSKLLPEIKKIIEDILDTDWPDSTMVDLLADIKKWEG